MATYTFEAIWATQAGGKIHTTVPVVAPTEKIAWEQLKLKIAQDVTLAAQKNNFHLIGTEHAPALTDEQKAVGRRIIDHSADRMIMAGKYRGRNVAFICETRDLGDDVAVRPVAIILTEDMLDDVADACNVAPSVHGTNWEK